MKAASPLVCVCVPSCNSTGTIARTLESLLGQTYGNLRILIVDNASTDKTVEIAEACARKDPRIAIVRNQENIGAEGNFTRCIELASGEYCAIFHADDVYSPTMVAEQVDFLEKNPEAGAVYTMAVGVDSSGAEGKRFSLPSELSKGPAAAYTFEEIFRAMLKHGNFLFCPSAMARMSIYKDYIRKWDAGNYETSADLDVWLRILQKGPVGIIDKPLLRYNVSGSSYSYRAARAKTGPHDMFRVFDAYIRGVAAGLMGRREREDYEFLVLKDRANRAFNLVLADKREEASALLGGLFCLDRFRQAASSLTRFKVLAYGCFVYFCSLLPMSDAAKKILFRTRFGPRVRPPHRLRVGGLFCVVLRRGR